MWNYEKRLQYPINITTPNAKIAQISMSQYGGPDGEMGASMRYLSQRYSMPDRRVCGVLTDIGTEELAHLEMVASIVRQLTKGLSAEELEAAGFAPYYVDHTGGIWPQAAGGIPFNACEFQSKGDALTDLFEDMAAEQKARTMYDSLFIYTIYSCRSVTHSTYCIMHVLFELCNLKLADQFTQILSLTAHLLAGSRTFLGCCGIRLHNVIDLLNSLVDLMDRCCLCL